MACDNWCRTTPALQLAEHAHIAERLCAGCPHIPGAPHIPRDAPAFDAPHEWPPPSMPRLNTSARLQTSLRLPSRTRGKHRRLRELLDAEDEDRTVVQS